MAAAQPRAAAWLNRRVTTYLLSNFPEEDSKAYIISMNVLSISSGGAIPLTSATNWKDVF
jgi:hypothetical protein